MARNVNTEVVPLEKGLDLVYKTSFAPSENPVYVTSLALSLEQGVLSAGDSDGCIKCYNYDSFTPLVELKNQSQNITGLEFMQGQPNVLWSASGTTLSYWDIRSGNTNPVKALESPNNSPFTCCSVSCSGDTIAAGSEKLDEDACIFLWDVRKTSRYGSLMTLTDSHQDDITQVRFHPSRSLEMVSGSTDGLSCVFDIAKENEDEALQSVLNSESSVSQIGYFGQSQNQLYCITHIETLQLWSVPEASLQHDFGDVREKFSDLEPLDYLVDCFYRTERQDLFLVGGSHSGGMQLFQVMDSRLETICLLRGGRSATVRCCLWDGQKIISGGEDSIICCWAPESSAGGLDKRLRTTGKVLPGAMDKLKVHGPKPYDIHRRKKKKETELMQFHKHRNSAAQQYKLKMIRKLAPTYQECYSHVTLQCTCFSWKFGRN